MNYKELKDMLNKCDCFSMNNGVILSDSNVEWWEEEEDEDELFMEVCYEDGGYKIRQPFSRKDIEEGKWSEKYMLFTCKDFDEEEVTFRFFKIIRIGLERKQNED